MPTEKLTSLLDEAKRVAKLDRALGRSLGIVGEITEREAARLLGLELAPLRTAGYDAIRR
jgi:hypothetical protein